MYPINLNPAIAFISILLIKQVIYYEENAN